MLSGETIQEVRETSTAERKHPARAPYYPGEMYIAAPGAVGPDATVYAEVSRASDVALMLVAAMRHVSWM